MVVLMLTAVPASLRGHLTRWLLEIGPGVFVGHVSARVRDLMWARVLEMVKDGRAIMVYNQRSEQRLAFKVHRHDWEPIDLDGVQLMMRPNPGQKIKVAELRSGWSNASRYRRATKRT
jgi:CRISPR-associated protein Cas2